jgi:hypothetical protein
LSELHGTVSSFESRMLDLDQRERRAERESTKFDVGVLSDQAGKANDVLAWRAFSWTQLFDLLEQIQPWNVRMTTIRPVFHRETRAGARSDAASHSSVMVIVDGMGKTYEDVLELQRALLTDPHFDRVDPNSIRRADNGEFVYRMQFLYHADAVDAPPADEPADEPADQAGVVAEADSAAEQPGEGEDHATDDSQVAVEVDATADAETEAQDDAGGSDGPADGAVDPAGDQVAGGDS